MAAVALSAGGAKGDYNEWNLADDTAGYWETAANWTAGGTGDNVEDWRVGANKKIVFGSAVTGHVVDGTTFTMTVGENNYTGTYENGVVTFSDVTVGGLGTTTSYTITAAGGSTGTTGAQSATVGNAVDGSTWMKADANGNYVFTVKHRNEQGELVAITPADNVTTTVTLKYGTGAASLSGSATGAAISPAEMFSQAGLNGSNVIYYKAEVSISAK